MNLSKQRTKGAYLLAISLLDGLFGEKSCKKNKKNQKKCSDSLHFWEIWWLLP